MCNKKLLHNVCSGHMKFIVNYGEIKVEKQNMGHVLSRNEKKTHIGFLMWLPKWDFFGYSSYSYQKIMNSGV